jgi:phenylalanyl-tRNA synthetase beta chain
LRILVSWLRDFVAIDVSIDELAAVLTMRGFEVSAIDLAPATVQGDGEDAVLDLEITTNRPDCLSVFGIAREVSTIYGTELRAPRVDETASLTTAGGSSDVSVSIDDPDLCPRYVASVADITLGPSPTWLAARLDAAGVRPINNIVDITNYVMLELGHPMHAFDLESLADRSIRVRKTASGETVRTLDGQERRLQHEMLVIADAVRPHAVAGVMGGADSEVSNDSRLVVLESAYFRTTSVRRTSKRLALSTDASYRFERGADIEAPVVAMRRALTLLEQTGAGRIRGSIVDTYPHPKPSETVTLRHTRIARVLGIAVDPSFVVTTLDRLGFSVSPPSASAKPGDEGQQWQIGIPTWRVDVGREIDLIEEVARHYGYDRLASTFPPLLQPPAPLSPYQRRQRLLNRVLTSGGCSEAINFSFADRTSTAPFVQDESDLVSIANPLSEKFTVLRPSLLPGLLESLIRNRRREQRDIRLFEIGKRFRRTTGETLGIAIAITGGGAPEHWSAPARPVDLFDIKGLVERTCEALGAIPLFEQTVSRVLVTGRASSITGISRSTGEQVSLGIFGQLTPTIATNRGFPSTGDEVYVAELDLVALAEVAVDRNKLHAAPVPRYPSVVRDLALSVDGTLPAAAVRDTIQTAAPDTLVSVHEFDRYVGPGVPDGCVSLALRLTFRASDRTLTDVEVQAAVDAIVAALQNQHGATLR